MTFILFYKKRKLKKQKYIFLSKKIYYNEDSVLFFKMFLGSLIKDGKKNKAYRIFCDYLYLLKKYHLRHINALFKCLNKIRPNIVLFKKRRGTSIFELPRLLSLNQEKSIALKWIIKDPLKKKKKKTSERLVLETNKILLNQGEILKKKKHILTVSKDNRPFFYLLRRRKKRR